MKQLIERYLNGILWFAKNKDNNSFSFDTFADAADTMASLERQMKEKGLTEDQLSKLLYVGNNFSQQKIEKMTDKNLNYVIELLNPASE